MDGISAFWSSVTEAQATIISAILTVLAAVAGVGLGWWLFSGKVKDLQGAVVQSDNILTEHKNYVVSTLDSISTKLSVMDEQFSAFQEALGQLRGSADAAETVATGTAGTDAQADSRQMLRDAWAAVRDSLEQVAADPWIDGRTRAKYARIDRRQYWALVDALANDGNLGRKTRRYEEAIDIWQRYRNGRRAPAKADIERMQELSQELAGA